MRCPECKSVNFVRARMFWWEYFLLLLISRPFRCEGCLGRMYGFVWVRSRPRTNKPKKPVAKPAARSPQTPAAVRPLQVPVTAGPPQAAAASQPTSAAAVSAKPPLPL